MPLPHASARIDGRPATPSRSEAQRLWKGIETLLARLDRILARAIQAAREDFGAEAGGDPYRGLYISPEDIQRILARAPGAALFKPGAQVASQGIWEHAAELLPRFATLQGLFDLDAGEMDLVLLALAPELDVRYERLYSYLQDDVTRKRPSVDLALCLLCPAAEDKLTLRRAFHAASALMRHHLIELIEEPTQPQSPLIKKYLKLDERIVDFLLGVPSMDPRLAPAVLLIDATSAAPLLLLEEKHQQRVVHFAAQAHSGGHRTIFYFQGSYGVGKQSCAQAVCAHIGKNLLRVDLERLIADPPVPFGHLLRLIEREALLNDAWIYWNGFDRLLNEKHRGLLAPLLQALQAGPAVAFLSGDETWEPAGSCHDLVFLRMGFDPPDYGQRLELWQHFLNGHAAGRDGLDLEAIANQFRLSGGQIKDAAATARNLARWRKPQAPVVDTQDLFAACRLQSNRKLTGLARKIEPRSAWHDIVLPKEQMDQLRSICTYVRHRALVMERWGFERKLSLGKGFNALFAGPSGTGKTMAAEVIARELRLDLYKIDLSTVVSKYIGETEKNLAQIFREAETSNAILFFDEADALFGKRSEVKDSHDRYANIEISYLLQKMEEYQGVSILATNLRQNMDDAFVRRVALTIHFPMPDEANRLTIWQKTWPADAPRGTDLDLAFMAQRFRVSGGNIKNIALAAAFFAADDDRTIAMRHIIRAAREELHKMGKACVKNDFGPYYDMLCDGRVISP
ncbi:MAG: AAA family ATPase [Desulfatitalea sp.]